MSADILDNPGINDVEYLGSVEDDSCHDQRDGVGREDPAGGLPSLVGVGGVYSVISLSCDGQDEEHTAGDRYVAQPLTPGQEGGQQGAVREQGAQGEHQVRHYHHQVNHTQECEEMVEYVPH